MIGYGLVLQIWRHRRPSASCAALPSQLVVYALGERGRRGREGGKRERREGGGREGEGGGKRGR